MNAEERRAAVGPWPTPGRRLGPALRSAVLLCGLLLVAADWPQFLGPNRDGTSPEVGLLQSWPAMGPTLLWRKNVGAGYAGPVLAGERLILFHRVGGNEVVECLDPATGTERWRYPYASSYRDDYGKGDGPRSTPLVAAGKVYTLGPAGALHCLDLESGKPVWQRSVNDDYSATKGFFGVATSPLLEGNLLLVNVGGKGAGIVAFDKDTGKEVWKATDHEASYSSPVAATIAGSRIVFFFTREGLVGLDPRTGTTRSSKRWRARIHASVNAATPLVVGDQLFLSASYNTGAVLLSVRKDSVAEMWKSDDVLSCHYDTAVHHDGFLYGIDGRQEEGARLRCIEMKTGKVRWTREGFGCASLILADGNLIALSENGDLVLMEATPAAYRERARATILTRPCRAPIALANGRLHARDDRTLGCWALKK